MLEEGFDVVEFKTTPEEKDLWIGIGILLGAMVLVGRMTWRQLKRLQSEAG
jgi:hypothetical protein